MENFILCKVNLASDASDNTLKSTIDIYPTFIINLRKLSIDGCFLENIYLVEVKPVSFRENNLEKENYRLAINLHQSFKNHTPSNK